MAKGNVGDLVSVGAAGVKARVIARVGRMYCFKGIGWVDTTRVNINVDKVLAKRKEASIPKRKEMDWTDWGNISFVKADGSTRVALYCQLYNRGNGCVGYYDVSIGDWRAFRIERVLGIVAEGGVMRGDKVKEALTEKFPLVKVEE